MKKYTDPQGHQYIQLLQSQLIPLEKALKIGDMASVAKILQTVVPLVKALYPHVKNDNLKQYLIRIASGAQQMQAQLLNGGDITIFHNFVKSESGGLGGVLGELLGAVGDVVGGVVDTVGDLLGGLLGK